MESVEELRYLVLAAQREGGRFFAELLRHVGLTPAQAEVVTVVRQAGRGLTVREIGDRLVCEGGSPSRLVATLVGAGLLARGPREGDRRAVELTLTRDGERAAAQVAEAERQLHGGLAALLDPSEQRAVADALRKLVAGRPAGDAIARRRDEG
jgi:DNA-binding MarR family transcriptional regulator